MPFKQGGPALIVRLQKAPWQPLPAADPRVVVIAEQIGRSIENEPGHRKTLESVTRVGEIVQRVRQPIPLRFDCLRFQRRRTLAEVRFGQGTGTLALTVFIDEDETGGIHALQDRTTRSNVRSEEVHETGTGMDEELHDTALEPDRLPVSLAAVPDEYRKVQVTTGSGSPGGRRPGKNHGQRIGETAMGDTSRLVNGVHVHNGQHSRPLDQRRRNFPSHGMTAPKPAGSEARKTSDQPISSSTITAHRPKSITPSLPSSRSHATITYRILEQMNDFKSC
ncbi:hypothetical protein [Streptomyces sp. NBC_00199]|uniref:hypothetical protein n=1 Tax=Streptomyces sp. NBC_00199 TaxID=2975678 RepID=UPI002259BCAD|nr:hypothetical protein [Streptomyces sp. NBC_00199]MCX5262441.1 hypothetical protein [Streptomyces sp. NBC_00199]